MLALFDVQAWRQPTQAIHQPLGRRDCIGFGWAATHCFAATLAGQPLGTGHDRGGVGNEQFLGPLNDGSNGALFGVASPVREPLTTEDRFGSFAFGFALGGHAVNARTAIVVDRHVRVDGLIAEPAPPAIGFPNIVKPSHRVSSLSRHLSLSIHPIWCGSLTFFSALHADQIVACSESRRLIGSRLNFEVIVPITDERS